MSISISKRLAGLLIDFLEEKSGSDTALIKFLKETNEEEKIKKIQDEGTPRWARLWGLIKGERQLQDGMIMAIKARLIRDCQGGKLAKNAGPLLTAFLDVEEGAETVLRDYFFENDLENYIAILDEQDRPRWSIVRRIAWKDESPVECWVTGLKAIVLNEYEKEEEAV